MIPYRTKKALQNLLVTLLVLILLAVGVFVCWMLWLNRYIIYTQEGAKLDFDLSPEFSQGQTPVPPAPAPSVNIHYNESGNQGNTAFVRFSGYTVTTKELRDNFNTVYAQLMALPQGSTVALQLKDVEGYFYYDTALGRESQKVDISKMEALIAALQGKGHYLIAQIPAFQDKFFFLDDESAHVRFGLAQDGKGGALWHDKIGYTDGMSCYWFDPASEGCQSYLIQIILELRSKGFQEVLLENFRFPNTSMIAYDPDDMPEALNTAAAKLVQTCKAEDFAISFGCRNTSLTLPEGRTRLFITSEVVAADIAELVQKLTFADTNIRFGLLTQLHDTRFDEYCVLRPLSAAQD